MADGTDTLDLQRIELMTGVLRLAGFEADRLIERLRQGDAEGSGHADVRHLMRWRGELRQWERDTNRCFGNEAYAATPMWWARTLALDSFVATGGGDSVLDVERGCADNEFTDCAEQFMRTMEAHRDTLPLFQVPSLEPWPVGEPLPSEWSISLLMRKDELRAWAREHAPRWLDYAPLAEPIATPAQQPASVTEPGTVRHSTKGKRAHILNAEIEAAKAVATNPENVAAVYAVLQRYAEQGNAPFIGFVEDEGIKYAMPSGKVEIFTIEALRKRMRRAASAR